MPAGIDLIEKTEQTIHFYGLVTCIAKMCRDLYLAAPDFYRGKDVLVEQGLDKQFERSLQSGEKTYLPLEDVLHYMIICRSVRGIALCLEAGADPRSTMSLEGKGYSAMDLAVGQPALYTALSDYVRTFLYGERLQARRLREEAQQRPRNQFVWTRAFANI